MKTKKKEDLPGYPHYPQSEDITSRQPRSDNDVEQLGASGKSKIPVRKKEDIDKDATPEIVRGYYILIISVIKILVRIT